MDEDQRHHDVQSDPEDQGDATETEDIMLQHAITASRIHSSRFTVNTDYLMCFTLRNVVNLEFNVQPLLRW